MYPNPPPLSAMDEAKLFMQNRQLMAQLQNNPGLVYGQGAANPPQAVQNTPSSFLKPAASLNPLNLGQYVKMQEPNPGLQNHGAYMGLQAGNQIPGANVQRPPMPGGTAAQNPAANQAALMHTMMQNQQFINNNGNAANAAYMPNGPSMAGPAAAAQARLGNAQTVQSNQARAIANFLQQQQQQVVAAQQQQQQRQNLANAQQNAAAVAQNTAWLNAAVQRAIASGQLVIQNGKPVLVQNPAHAAFQQQQPQPQPNTAHAAQVLQQQFQAAQAAANNAAQKQAQQVQMVKQIQAALGQQAANATPYGPNANQANALALLKQVQLQDALAQARAAAAQPSHQLQDALAAVNGRAVPGIMTNPRLNGNGAALPAALPQLGNVNGGLLQLPQHLAQQPGQGQQAQAQQAHIQNQAYQHHHNQAQAQQAQAQAQAQQRIRQNMAALANLTPAQIQALSSNPALAQALLQARTAAAAGGAAQAGNVHGSAAAAQNQPSTSPAPGQPVNIPGVDSLLASLHPAGQQAARQQQPGATEQSPGSSVAGSPPNAMSKEQRRLALARVAMQLVHSGISVDQAIHSGIMGGMSVTDVRFIVEVYNAEQARLKDPATGHMHSAMGGEHGLVTAAAAAAAVAAARQLGSGAASPAPSSYAGSDAGTGRSRAGSIVGVEVGNWRSQAGSVAAVDIWSERSRTGSVVGADAPFGDGRSQLGSATGAPSAAEVVPDVAAFDEDAFNAFSYGFFGATDGQGELLGELESGLEGEGELGALEQEGVQGKPGWRTDDAMAGWPAAPAADGMPDTEDASAASAQVSVLVPEGVKQDDVAARLANLDLGSGFF